MTKSLRCRLRLHTWRKAFTPDNEKYLKCERCGKVDDVLGAVPNVLS